MQQLATLWHGRLVPWTSLKFLSMLHHFDHQNPVHMDTVNCFPCMSECLPLLCPLIIFWLELPTSSLHGTYPLQILLSNSCTQPLQQLMHTLHTIGIIDATSLRVHEEPPATGPAPAASVDTRAPAPSWSKAALANPATSATSTSTTTTKSFLPCNACTCHYTTASSLCHSPDNHIGSQLPTSVHSAATITIKPTAPDTI